MSESLIYSRNNVLYKKISNDKISENSYLKPYHINIRIVNIMQQQLEHNKKGIARRLMTSQ